MENGAARSPGAGTGCGSDPTTRPVSSYAYITPGSAHRQSTATTVISSDAYLNVSAPVPTYAWQQQQQVSPSAMGDDHQLDADLLWVQSISRMQGYVQSPPPSSPPRLVSATPAISTPSSSYHLLPTQVSLPSAATPLSSVSSTHPQGSSSSSPPSGSTLSSPPRSAGPPARTTHKKARAIDRNRRPCGACSSSKRKCKLVSLNPELCERCRKHGLSACPPHVAWSRRRAATVGDESQRGSRSLHPAREDSQSSISSAASLSPRSSMSEYDGSCLSKSRSASPLYPAVYDSLSLSPSPNLLGTSLSADTMDTYQYPYPPSAQAYADSAAVNAHYGPSPSSPPCMSSSPEMDSDTIATAAQPDMTPRCHVCSTPYAYDQLLLGYMLGQTGAPLPTSPSPSPSLSHPVSPPASATFAAGNSPSVGGVDSRFGDVRSYRGLPSPSPSSSPDSLCEADGDLSLNNLPMNNTVLVTPLPYVHVSEPESSDFSTQAQAQAQAMHAQNQHYELC